MAEPLHRLPGLSAGTNVGSVLRRAVGLRCPHCGLDALYDGVFRMRERCAECGLRYEREAGFFVGAIYLNYALTVAVGLGGVLLLDAIFPMSLAAELWLAGVAMVIVPVLFFRYARSAWLMMNYLASRPGPEDFR